MNETLPCVICKRKLDSALEGSQDHPSGGLVFSSAGNYGSTLFDGEVGELFLNICDDCVRSLSIQDQLGHKTITETQTVTLKLAKF